GAGGAAEGAETTALGAAALAGLAVGFWSSRQELARHWQADREFQPALKPAARRARLAGWEEALDRARGTRPTRRRPKAAR
ncbi:MAG: hypothetical protein ACKO3N_02635, partial [Verrucomicrobiota bacterium]